CPAEDEPGARRGDCHDRPRAAARHRIRRRLAFRERLEHGGCVRSAGSVGKTQRPEAVRDPSRDCDRDQGPPGTGRRLATGLSVQNEPTRHLSLMRSIHRMTRHRLHTVIALLAFVSCSLFPSLAAAAGKCKDIPLRVTIYSNAVTDSVTGATVSAAL